DAAAQVRGDLDQDRVVGLPPQALVEAVVEVEHGCRIAPLRGGHHAIDKATEVALEPGRPPLAAAPHHEPLEQDAHARHLRDALLRQLRHAGAAAREPDDEALVLELRQRLAHRDVADTQPVRQRAFDEPLPGRVLAVMDPLAQPIRNRIGQALVWKGLDRRRHRTASCRRYPICNRAGGGPFHAEPDVQTGRRRRGGLQLATATATQFCSSATAPRDTGGARSLLMLPPAGLGTGGPAGAAWSRDARPSCSPRSAEAPPASSARAPRPGRRRPGRRGHRDAYSYRSPPLSVY